MAHHNGEPLFALVERKQFPYYLTVAYMTADPEDSPAFRRRLGGVLVATRYLNRHLAATAPPDDASEEHQAMRLLDDIRDRYNSVVTRAGFVLELWTRRRETQLAMER